MRFLLIAILFVFAVAVFTVVSKYGYQASVETELGERATAALQAAGFDGVGVEFDHLDAIVTGEVDTEVEKAEVLAVLERSVPTAYLPDVESSELSIRPSMPPQLKVVRKGGSAIVFLKGKLAIDEDPARMLLGARIHALKNIESVDNAVELDPRRLPFTSTAEFAAIATNLITHSDEVRVILEDGTLTLEGEVANDGLKESIMELAGTIGVESVVDEIKVAEPISFRRPTVLKVTRNRFGITLSGMLATEQGKVDLITLFSPADNSTKVSDKIEVGEEYAPAIWEDHIEPIAPVLIAEFVGEMTVEFAHDQVRLAGNVASDESKKRLLAAFRPLKAKQPSLDILADVLIESGGEAGPEVRLLATYEGGLLKIDGIVPNDEFVAALEKSLEEAESEILVKNLLETSPSTSADWVGQLTEFFSEALARTENATFSLEGKVLRMEGQTVSLEDKSILGNVAVNTFPQDYRVENLLAHEQPPFPKPTLQPEARVKLGETLKALPVYFGSNSDEIEGRERTKIEKVAEVIEATGAIVSLQVTGFADNVGNAEYNRELSLRRANAVLQELVKLGFAEEIMKTDSVGEDVSNVSRSERWKARRVEVSVAPPEEEASSTE